MDVQIKDLQNTWRETWYAMAEGDPVKYNVIKGTPVLEFYALYDLWLNRLQKETEAIKSRKRKA